MKSLNFISILKFMAVALFLNSCADYDNLDAKGERHQQIETDHTNAAIKDLKQLDKLPIKKFRIGQVQPLPQLDTFKAFLSRGNFEIKKKPNIYLFFVDTLRKDHITPEIAPNLYKFMEDNVSFKHSVASAPVTHLSSYSIFHSRLAYQRNPLLGEKGNLWNIGSPFLNVLKQSGYKNHLYGSLWQYCIDLDPAERFTDPSILNDYGEPNLFLLYGRRTKDLFDFCYNQGFWKDGQDAFATIGLPGQNPQIPNVHKIPSTWLSKDHIRREIDNRLKNMPPEWKRRRELYERAKKQIDWDNIDVSSHDPGVVDDQVISDALRAISSQKQATGKLKDNLYILYLFGVHHPASIPKSKEFTGEYAYALDHPYWRFKDPELHQKNLRSPKYADLPEEEMKFWEGKMKNTYRNAVRGVDYQFGRFVKKLKELGEYDESMIVFFSDHGEFLFDKGLADDVRDRIGHCCDLYKQNTEVPIFIKFPRSAQSEVAKVVDRSVGSHIDIFPTILDYLEFNKFDEMKSEFFTGNSILKKQRNCAVTFHPVGKRFVITGKDGEKVSLILDEPNNVFNSTGIILDQITDYEGKVKDVGTLADYDQKKVYQFVSSKYKDCLSEIFTLNEDDQSYVKKPEEQFQEALAKTADIRNLRTMNDKLVDINMKDIEKNMGILGRTKGVDYVLVSTVIGDNHKILKKYFESEDLNQDSDSFVMERDYWVTAVPQLSQFCKSNKYYGDILPMRIRQYLGLKPSQDVSYVAELWVPVTKVFRPCSDKNIAEARCDYDVSGKDPVHEKWFLRNIDNLRNKYPFSGLGYTLDWATGGIGATEFVVERGTKAAISEIKTLEDYCKNSN